MNIADAKSDLLPRPVACTRRVERLKIKCEYQTNYANWHNTPDGFPVSKVSTLRYRYEHNGSWGSAMPGGWHRYRLVYLVIGGVPKEPLCTFVYRKECRKYGLQMRYFQPVLTNFRRVYVICDIPDKFLTRKDQGLYRSARVGLGMFQRPEYFTIIIR